MNTPAMRIKSRWFQPGARKTPAEQASAMAFIVWRVAHQMLKRMRLAGFEIEVGAPYFAFLREVLVFLSAVTDRIAHARLRAPERAEFTTALVRHVARTLDENEREYLGPPHGAAADERFIDLFNELAAHYAEFSADARESTPEAGFHPGFAFVRYLGHRLEATVPQQDRRWVIEQVQAVEVPEALAVVQRSMRELFDPAPRPARRAGLSGE